MANLALHPIEGTNINSIRIDFSHGDIIGLVSKGLMDQRTTSAAIILFYRYYIVSAPLLDKISKKIGYTRGDFGTKEKVEPELIGTTGVAHLVGQSVPNTLLTDASVLYASRLPFWSDPLGGISQLPWDFWYPTCDKDCEFLRITNRFPFSESLFTGALRVLTDEFNIRELGSVIPVPYTIQDYDDQLKAIYAPIIG